MSFQKRIESKIREIAKFNQIPIKLISVEEKTLLTERHYKKEIGYEVKIIFEKTKTPLDYFFVFYYYFVLRFKLYRCYYDNVDNSLNYNMKKRNMKVIEDIFKD